MQDVIQHKTKDEILDELYEMLEIYEQNNKLEIEFINNLLYINLADDKQYVLSLQENFLKLNSPFSGEQCFYFYEDKWISEKVGEIRMFLLDELEL